MFISRSKNSKELEWDGEFYQQFSAVARHYDELMSGVPYGMWVDYVELLLSLEQVRPRSVVDLACGTGNVSFELAKRGYQVTGVDISPAMIATARAKRDQSPDLEVEFQCQDLRTLCLPEKYDLAVCLFDSLNYILWEEELEAAFRNIAPCVTPEGLFIFDMNSEHALESELFTQNNLFREADLRYNWVSRFDRNLRISEVQMFFEVRNGGDEPARFKELHRERAYPLVQVLALLDRTGWNCLKTHEAYTTNRPRSRSERWYFVCRPKKLLEGS